MAETVVGMHWVPGGKIVPKVKRARRLAWTGAKEHKFIDHLSATCNIAASLREVGVTATSACRHRQQSAQFRAAWDRALNDGYAGYAAAARAGRGATQSRRRWSKNAKPIGLSEEQ